MNNKIINKEIRKLSNTSSLPVLIYILGTFALSFIMSFALYFLRSVGITFTDEVFNLILYAIIDLVIMPLCLLVFYIFRGKKTGLTIRSGFTKPKKSTGWIAKWIIIGTGFGYITSYACTFITSLIETIFNITITTEPVDFGITPIGVITTVSAVMIGAPIFEELLFRNSVYRNNELMGQGFAVVITGITFGLWHTNGEQTVFASVLGIFLCFLYAKTRSVIPSMILHFVVNTLGSLMSFTYSALGTEMPENPNMNYVMQNLIPILCICLFIFLVFGLMIAAVVLLIIELVKHKGKFGLKKSIFPYSLGKRLAVYFSAPVTIILFVLMIAMTIYYTFLR